MERFLGPLRLSAYKNVHSSGDEARVRLLTLFTRILFSAMTDLGAQKGDEGMLLKISIVAHWVPWTAGASSSDLKLESVFEKASETHPLNEPN